MLNLIRFIGFVGITGLLFVPATRAQEVAEAPIDDAAAAAPETSEPREASAGAEPAPQNDREGKTDETLERLDRLEAQVEAGRAENAQLKAEMADLRDEVELAAMGDEELDTTQPLMVFGFFDLTYFKGFYQDDSLFRLYSAPAGSFTISNLNLYFKSELTESLSAIAELRFSYLPQGVETSYEYETIMDDGTEDGRVSSGGTYNRVDTFVRDPITALEFNQGGLAIERVHVTYSPLDWLGVIAGRFLTPYGIWNIDHGSPVVLPVRLPYLQSRGMMPLAQTGLQIFGRVFPTDSLFLDYALTVSNGRGPTEAYLDFDENKGVGLKLRLTYSGGPVEFHTGSYGYFGEYTDIKKRTVARVNDDLTPDMSRDDAMTVQVIPVNAYHEAVVSYDFKIAFFGAEIQSEVVWRRVFHSVHPMMNKDEAAINGLSPLEDYYMPDYVAWGAYVLGAYTLPIPVEWLQLTPYVMYEYGDPLPTSAMSSSHFLIAGLNIKPSPYVVLKAEYNRVWNASELVQTVNLLALQMAVSF